MLLLRKNQGCSSKKENEAPLRRIHYLLPGIYFRDPLQEGGGGYTINKTKQNKTLEIKNKKTIFVSSSRNPLRTPTWFVFRYYDLFRSVHSRVLLCLAFFVVRPLGKSWKLHKADTQFHWLGVCIANHTVRKSTHRVEIYLKKFK